MEGCAKMLQASKAFFRHDAKKRGYQRLQGRLVSVGHYAWVVRQPIDKRLIRMRVHDFLRNFKPPPPKYLEKRARVHNLVSNTTVASFLDHGPDPPANPRFR